MVYGDLNPRNLKGYPETEVMDLQGLSKVYDTTSSINLYQNYQQLLKTNSTIDICSLDKDQINAHFGSKVKNLHWIDSKERKGMNTTSATRAYSYNKSLPHFQFAYALYHQPNRFIDTYITTYGQNIENSMEHQHNTMHTFLPVFMNDAELSIISPLFLLFHCFVDY